MEVPRLTKLVAPRDIRIRERGWEAARLGARVGVQNEVCHRAYEANNRAGRSTTEREVRTGVAEARRVLLRAWETGSRAEGPVTSM
jgi:hypothetical protein